MTQSVSKNNNKKKRNSLARRGSQFQERLFHKRFLQRAASRLFLLCSEVTFAPSWGAVQQTPLAIDIQWRFLVFLFLAYFLFFFSPQKVHSTNARTGLSLTYISFVFMLIGQSCMCFRESGGPVGVKGQSEEACGPGDERKRWWRSSHENGHIHLARYSEGKEPQKEKRFKKKKMKITEKERNKKHFWNVHCSQTC